MRRLVLILTVGTLVMTGCGGGGGEPDCPSPDRMTSIELVDFAFEPLCVEASGGDVLSLTNSGDAPHTFTVTQVDLNVDLDAGETGEANLTGVAPGLYAVTCTFHPQMVGALKIV